MDILERAQKRVANMTKDLGHQRRDSKRSDSSTWRKEGSGGILSISVSTWRTGVKKTEPGYSRWCPVTVPVAN